MDLTGHRLRVWTAIAGALASGAAFGLCMTYDLPWLAAVALVPLLVAVRGSPTRKALWLGALAGGAQAFVLWHWLGETSRLMGHGPWPGLAMLVLLMLVRGAVMSMFAALWERGRIALNGNSVWSIPALVYGPALWVGLEYLYDAAINGLSLTFFATLGYSQAGHPIPLQIASIAGVHGVSFVLVLANVGLADGVGRWMTKPAVGGWWRPLSGTAVVVVLWLGFGVARLAFADGRTPLRTLRVAVLQGNVPAHDKFDRTKTEALGRRYLELAAQANASRPDLIVWSEAVIPWPFEEGDELSTAMLKATAASGAGHVIGALSRGETTNTFRNSAFLALPDGRVVAQYDKVRLLRFTERPVELSRFLRFRNLHPHARHLEPGCRPPVLEGPMGVLGVSICNENFDAGQALGSVRQGAEILLCLANDVWLGRWTAVRQHSAASILRSVETGRASVVADNPGFSCIVDRFGRRQVWAPMSEAGCWSATVGLWRDLTPYVRIGHAFPFLCLALAVGLPFIVWVRSPGKNARVSKGGGRV